MHAHSENEFPPASRPIETFEADRATARDPSGCPRWTGSLRRTGRRRPSAAARRASRPFASIARDPFARATASLVLLCLASGEDGLEALRAGSLPELISTASADETPSSVSELLEWRYREGIRDRVSIALELEFRDDFCDPAEFDVQASPDGVVTLEGRVCDASSLERAERVARHQAGVTDVVLRLDVVPSASPSERMATTASPTEMRPDGLAGVDPLSSDEEMSEDLAASLAAHMGSPTRTEHGCFSDPRVVGERWSVALDVDDETLRVSGAVEDEASRARIRSWAQTVRADSRRIERLDLELAASDAGGFWSVFGL